jgi:Rieske Fe-S protein
VAAVADVPVGGGVVVADHNLVVTQPTRGRFRGFSATCTHQGCTVSSVDDTINCPCHGSQYAITDGSVVGGPAPRGLPEKPVRVDGDQIRLA